MTSKSALILLACLALMGEGCIIGYRFASNTLSPSCVRAQVASPEPLDVRNAT